MQSSSSLECTLNWKHSFSSTCRHPPILRVADRVSASRSQRSVVPRPWLHVTLTLSTQQASLNPCTKSWPGLQLSIWFSFLVAAFSSLRSNGRCRIMCTCATCYWLNRRVLENIEATNATRGHIHRYKHSLRRGTLSQSMWGSLRLAPISQVHHDVHELCHLHHQN